MVDKNGLRISCVLTLVFSLLAPNSSYGQAPPSKTSGSSSSAQDWFQKPFLHTDQLPPGFYYLFRSGDMLPTYYIKIPTELEKKKGEVPYIENRTQARKIDAQYKTESNDPHLSFKTLTRDEEAKAAQADQSDESSKENSQVADEKERSKSRKDPRKAKSPFKKNNYLSTFKGLPRGGLQVLFGPTVAPNSPPPFKFDDKDLPSAKPAEKKPEEAKDESE